MWWRDKTVALGRVLRLAIAMAAAGLVAGCFQPLYGNQSPPTGSVAGALASVEVPPIEAPQGTPQARVAVELRNDVIFLLTGGSGGLSPAHRLKINVTVSHAAVIVDIATGRTEDEVTGIDANYTMVELATGRVVATGSSFARVTSDVPGQEQRFARARAQRDAENRAAQVVAEQIRSRLASYFVAGT
jgi:LPS-assembly lipoprotein